jgi:hypothetical protein
LLKYYQQLNYESTVNITLPKSDFNSISQEIFAIFSTRSHGLNWIHAKRLLQNQITIGFEHKQNANFAGTGIGPLFPCVLRATDFASARHLSLAKMPSRATASRRKGNPDRLNAGPAI